VLVEFFVLHLGGPFPSNSTISHSKAGCTFLAILRTGP
jgi:hypothetical protein